MDMVKTIVEEVRWRNKIGTLKRINIASVTEVAEELYPDVDWDSSDLIFQIMMNF